MTQANMGNKKGVHLMNDGTAIHRPGDGYWIAPSGHVLRLKSRHIVAVCERTDAFGISKTELEALFTSRGEVWATEQSAREITIKALINQAGWIRVRHYHRRHAYWSVNLPILDSEQRVRIGAFLQLLGRTVSPDDRVRLDALEGQEWTTIRALTELHNSAASMLVFVEELRDVPKSPTPVSLRSLQAPESDRSPSI